MFLARRLLTLADPLLGVLLSDKTIPAGTSVQA